MTFDQMYRKHIGNGFTTIDISGDMVRSMMQGSAANDPNLTAFTNGIVSIRMVVAECYHRGFSEDMVAISNSGEYNMLARIVKDGEQLVIMYKNKDTKLRNTAYPQSEFLIMQMGKTDNFAMNIRGNLNLRYINSLSKIRIVNMDSVEKFTAPKPNPANIQVPPPKVAE